jgi:hypothetical protein
VRRTVELDAELESRLAQAASAAKQDPAVVLLEAVRVGLPSLSGTISTPPPDGFFSDGYDHEDSERLALEKSMSNVVQRPER